MRWLGFLPLLVAAHPASATEPPEIPDVKRLHERADAQTWAERIGTQCIDTAEFGRGLSMELGDAWWIDIQRFAPLTPIGTQPAVFEQRVVVNFHGVDVDRLMKAMAMRQLPSVIAGCTTTMGFAGTRGDYDKFKRDLLDRLVGFRVELGKDKWQWIHWDGSAWQRTDAPTR